MFTLTQFKQQTEKVHTRNFKFVKIRADRYCEHCGTKLICGTTCLSINPKFKERVWICDDCVERRLNLHNARLYKASIAFDDEGGYLAAQEWEDEALAAIYDE